MLLYIETPIAPISPIRSTSTVFTVYAFLCFFQVFRLRDRTVVPAGRKKGRPGEPDAPNWQFENSLAGGELAEEPEKAAGEQRRGGQGKHPGSRDVANGGELEPTAVGGHGPGNT